MDEALALLEAAIDAVGRAAYPGSPGEVSPDITPDQSSKLNTAVFSLGNMDSDIFRQQLERSHARLND